MTSSRYALCPVRQLLVLGEQTGPTAEVLRPVGAAAAVIEREKDDTTRGAVP